jgi:hypothetical protein
VSRTGPSDHIYIKDRKNQGQNNFCGLLIKPTKIAQFSSILARQKEIMVFRATPTDCQKRHFSGY